MTQSNKLKQLNYIIDYQYFYLFVVFIWKSK